MNVEPAQFEPLAVELAAHQRVRLGDFTGASGAFAELAGWAEKSGDVLLRVRALKYQAEIHEYKNELPNVTEANRLLNRALELLPRPLPSAHIIEAAELHEMQGRVRAKRPSFDWDDAALTSLTDAEGLYRQLNGAIAVKALPRLAEGRANILSRRHSPSQDQGNGAGP